MDEVKRQRIILIGEMNYNPNLGNEAAKSIYDCIKEKYPDIQPLSEILREYDKIKRNEKLEKLAENFEKINSRKTRLSLEKYKKMDSVELYTHLGIPPWGETTTFIEEMETEFILSVAEL